VLALYLLVFRHYLQIKNLSTPVALTVGLGWVLLLFLYYRKNAKKIIATGNEESKIETTKGVVIFIFYLLFTLATTYLTILNFG
jgi:hypothetical protein